MQWCPAETHSSPNAFVRGDRFSFSLPPFSPRVAAEQLGNKPRAALLDGACFSTLQMHTLTHTEHLPDSLLGVENIIGAFTHTPSWPVFIAVRRNQTPFVPLFLLLPLQSGLGAVTAQN